MGRARRVPNAAWSAADAIARHLSIRVVPLDERDLNRGMRGDHDGPVGQGVGANRREHQDIEMRLDDGTAAGKRIRRRARRRGDDDAVARVRVDVLAVHSRFEVQHAAGGCLL
jgi:hypothetical protein